MSTKNVWSRTRIIAVAGGKGGVGKTVCVANLALHLAETRRVLAVDLNLGRGNLKTALGVRSYTKTLQDFLNSDATSLDNFKTETALENLKFVVAPHAPVKNTTLSREQVQRLVASLRADSSDYVLMDLGDGVGDDALELFSSANLKLIVTGPESVALHNSFVFVKSFAFHAMISGLERAQIDRRQRDDIATELYEFGGEEIGTPLERIREKDAATAALMQKALAAVRIGVILNKTQDDGEERFRDNLQRLVSKNARLNLTSFGSIPYDENIKKSLNETVPFARNYRNSPANSAFRDVAVKVALAAAGMESAPASDGQSLEQLATVILDTGAKAGPKNPIGKLVSMVGDTWNSVSNRLRPDPPNEPLELPALEAGRPASSHKSATELKQWNREVSDLREIFERVEPKPVPAAEPAEETVAEPVAEPPAALTAVEVMESEPLEQSPAAETPAELLDAVPPATAHVELPSQAPTVDVAQAPQVDDSRPEPEEEEITPVQEGSASKPPTGNEELPAAPETPAAWENPEVRDTTPAATPSTEKVFQNARIPIAAEEMLGQLGRAFTQTDSRITELMEEVQARDERILTLESMIAEGKRASEQARAEHSRMFAEQKLSLEARVAAKDAQIAELQEEVATGLRAVESLRSQLLAAANAAAENRREMQKTTEELNTSVVALQQDQRTSAARIRELQAGITAREQAATAAQQDFQNTLGEKESKTKSLQSDLIAKDAHILVIEAELRDSKRAAERVRADLDAKLRALADHKTQAETTAAERESQLAEALRQLSDRGQFIRNLQEEHQGRLRAANEQKERLIGTINEKDVTIEQMSQEARALEQKIAALESELGQTSGLLQSMSNFLTKRGDVPPRQ